MFSNTSSLSFHFSNIFIILDLVPFLSIWLFLNRNKGLGLTSWLKYGFRLLVPWDIQITLLNRWSGLIATSSDFKSMPLTTEALVLTKLFIFSFTSAKLLPLMSLKQLIPTLYASSQITSEFVTTSPKSPAFTRSTCTSLETAVFAVMHSMPPRAWNVSWCMYHQKFLS